MRRVNNDFVTAAVLTQGAIISCLDKKGSKQFQKLISKLGGDPKQIDKRPRKITDTKDIPIRGPKDQRVPKRPKRDETGAPPRPKNELLK